MGTRPAWSWGGLTCDDDEGGKAGEGGDVDTHAVQALGELEDGVDPLSEAAHALLPVQHHPVAEDEFPFLWLRAASTNPGVTPRHISGSPCSALPQGSPVRQAQDEELQEG